MKADAYLVVNPVRRKRSITVRWTPDYLLGRFLIVLGVNGHPMSKDHLIRTFTLLDNPRSLYAQARLRGIHLPNDNVLPAYMCETLSHPLPPTTPKYDQALCLGVAYGLLLATRENGTLRFYASTRGVELLNGLLQDSPLDRHRAELALQLAAFELPDSGRQPGTEVQ